MKGAKREEINNFVKFFWGKFLPKYQNKAVINRLNWHHKKAHRIYVVTASFDFYAEYLKKIWPLDGVIATKAEWSGNILTGKISGENCKGALKVKRIQEELGINLQTIRYYAYTDSYSDIALLKNADYAMIINLSKISVYENHSK